MNILFTSPTSFHPQKGGVGRVTDTLCREFQKSCEQRYHCPRFLEFPDYFGLRMLINAHRMLYGWVWLCQV